MAFKKTPLEESVRLFSTAKVSVCRMGHLVEVQHMTTRNKVAHTQKLSKTHYLNLKTGEICEYKLNENRAQNTNSLAKTFKRLRRIINNNFSGSKNELFVTLTFKKNSADHKMVYQECDRFLKRLRYKYKDISKIEHLNVLEPHADGQWHTHLLLKFVDLDSIYIRNDDLAEIWGQGITKTKSLQNVDNIGAYLSAYLSDLDLPDDAPYNEGREDIEVKIIDGEKKKFLKGGRLAFYPSGMRIIRKSKGIIEPEQEDMYYGEIKKEVGYYRSPDFSKSIRIESEDYTNTITYENYNLKR